ncbi:MAG: acetyl-CoA decarbonylase/synthase complex subunit gamma [Candidatus Omnitrophica bacterium]|nr:acetyl-CoA decarbonylase/synthase complex subunit gamma [Candidatus Omnitrophota bacterium]
MALSGLDIYKQLPKTNCKECGFATCLAFAMALAQKKVSLDKCPHVTAAVRLLLESASQPPMKLVTIGTGGNKIEIGNETVMYRHEQKFFHPAAIGFLAEDTLSDDELAKKVAEIDKLKFERVGQQIGVDLICVKASSGNKDRFAAVVKKVVSQSGLNIALFADAASTGEALKVCKEKRPLIICDEPSSIDDFIKLSKDNSLPLAVSAKSLDEAAQLTDRAKNAGVGEIVINLERRSIAKRIQDFTFARRSALRKNFRPLGYPVIAFTDSDDPDLELAEAISYVVKYAGIVIVKNTDKDYIFPLLVARQDIYQDPQKPVQVEPKIYEIGKVSKSSPVLVTTNFSITYFTVAGEVEASKIPSYLIACDAEGMSVLTAWAAEKFTAEKIADTLKTGGIADIVAHRKVVIPGYVSVLSGKLEEVSGWKVSVGPKEASGITNFLRSLK